MAPIDYDQPEPKAWVTMRHPGIEGTAEASREAFEEVWREKGWVLAPETAEEVAPPVPVNAEQAAAMGVDLAEVGATETAPSDQAVIGGENPVESQDTKQSKSQAKTKE